MKTVVDLTASLKTYFLGKDTTAKQAVEGNIATVETDATSASKGYSEGEQLFLNDVLYDVIATITAGDALAVGTNIDVSSKITSQLNTIKSDISNKQDKFQVSTMPTASAAYSGKVLIYIGTTTQYYTSGQSYQCIEESGSYSWKKTNEVDPVILTQTLAAGSTTLTFNNTAISNNSRISYLSDPFVLGLIENAVQSGTTVTLTCKEQASSVSVMLEIKN